MKLDLKKRFTSLLPGKKKNGTNSEEEQRNREIPQENLIFHKQPLDELLSSFGSSLTNGLDEKAAADLLIKNGPNRIKQVKENKFKKIVGYFLGGFGSLFLIAAIACIICWKPLGSLNGGTSDIVNLALGVLLLVVICIQAGFNAFQDWSSSKVMNSIKNMMPSSAYVIRNGKEQPIPVEELVTGDIVRLMYGNKVPADCRIIESKDLKFDKSMLTGESEAIEGVTECTDEKYVESKNIGFMTTLVTNGQGKGVVVATGDQTIMGKIAGFTSQTTHKKTSLQEEIHRFVKIVVILAITTAAVVVITWAAWLRVKYPTYINYITIIINTIGVIIGFIPDGLPVSVTLSLLIIAMRMKKSNVLVKNLTVIETLSCVNVIASDKTGTLTQNKMFVASAATGTEQVNLDEVSSSEYERTIGFNQLVSACGLCNNASFEEDKDVPIKTRKAKGDATDIALLKFSAEYENFSNLNDIYDTTAEIPFNSKNKWMAKVIKPKNAVVHRQIFGDEDDMNSDIILLKGAPDYLIKKSTHIIQSNGHEIPIRANVLNTLTQIQNDWCILGQRVLIVTKKKCKLTSSVTNDLETFIQSSNDFCIIGLVGIIDPPREGIADVLAKCKTAGIRVLMVTGDYALTAAAIALKIGILTQPQYDTAETMRLKVKTSKDGLDFKSLLLTGNDLDNITPDEWRIVTQYKEIVLARTTPEQKLMTVKEFQNDKYIVGVTGDGVNDAPALKAADIGIAMGSGSEVAMEAAQLVLLDNNFSSILVAIENGRLVFDNLRKVILFLLPGGSMGDMIPILMSIFLGVPLNISSFAMVAVSLFTDLPPSMTMMKEPPETDLLAQPPRTKNDHLADKTFLIQAYGFMGVMVSFFSQLTFFIYMGWYMNMSPSKIFLAFDGIYANYNETNYDKLIHKYPNLTMTQVRHEFNEQYYYAQTVTFVAIVMLQTFGNLLSTRTHIKSFFQQTPWNKKTGNKLIFLAIFIAMVLMIIFVYVPIFHTLFNTRPIPAQFIFIPLVFCVIMFTLDELRKLAVRKNVLCFPKIAW